MKFLIPKRDPKSHKGQNGRVLVVGGSPEYVGAPALAGLAALRSGCDIVTVMAPAKVAWAINTYTPDLMTRKLSGDHLSLSHYRQIVSAMEHYDVLLLGNGMGLHKSSIALARKLAALPVPKVIDADALKAIDVRNVRNAVFTPNKKELAFLCKNAHIAPTENPLLLKHRFSTVLSRGNVFLIKGPTDYIITSDGPRGAIIENTIHNPGMTKGGTGDVLAGLAAGYLAQKCSLTQAAYNAAYVNGQVGNILKKKKKGYVYLASDMVDEIAKLNTLTSW